jgi:hypothetical protein
MKTRFFVFHAVPAALFIGIVFSFLLTRGTVFAQVSSVARTGINSPVRKASSGTDKSTIAARFLFAASENSRLRTALNWTFGGKVQSGWEIYVPLVSTTIGTSADASAPEFAAALSKWQSDRGLNASGILDEVTLGAFTKFWQSQRLGRSDFPGDDRLVAAPIADFFDPTRDPELLKLERETYTAYKKMIAAASKDLGQEIRFTRNGELAPGEKFLRIVSAYRSPEYQAELRRKEPGAGRAALALKSPHNTGQALDLYVGGEPVTTKDANRLIQVKTPAYQWLVKNANRFGFYNYFYEPWHWEYVGKR